MGWDDEEIEYMPVKGTVKAGTEKAILVVLENGDEQWMPRSVVEDGDSFEKGDKDPNVAEWFCDKEGLA